MSRVPGESGGPPIVAVATPRTGDRVGQVPLRPDRGPEHGPDRWPAGGPAPAEAALAEAALAEAALAEAAAEPVNDQNADGFGQFVELRWPSLVRFGYLLTGDWGAAEDLTQAALERTWRRWDRVRVDHPESYVKAAMANQMRSRWRRRGGEVVDGRVSERRDAGDVGNDVSADHALRETLWAELMRLPVRMRAVVVLRIWEDLSEAETARLLGCSVGSVKSQMSRGMQRLRSRPEVLEAVGRKPSLTDENQSEGPL
jgi:RNA polymerase sigma-70 factor (sigma-E family)